jgi:hypothetical protein
MNDHPECGLVSAAARVISEGGEFVRHDNFPPEFLLQSQFYLLDLSPNGHV